MPFRFDGATGEHAAAVKGVYVPSDEMKNGRRVYLKVGDPTRCLWFGPNSTWMASPVSYKNENNAACAAYCIETGLDAPYLATRWKVFVDGEFQEQATVALTPLSAQVRCTARVECALCLRCLCVCTRNTLLLLLVTVVVVVMTMTCSHRCGSGRRRLVRARCLRQTP